MSDELLLDLGSGIRLDLGDDGSDDDFEPEQPVANQRSARKRAGSEARATKAREKGPTRDQPPAPPENWPTMEQAEAASAVESNVLLQDFKDHERLAEQRVADAIDSDYWFVVTCQNREQKDELLRKLKLLDHGDKYLDGMIVAHVLGVELESRVPPEPVHRADPRLADLT